MAFLAVPVDPPKHWINDNYAHLPSAAWCSRMYTEAATWAKFHPEHEWRRDAWKLAWELRCPEQPRQHVEVVEAEVFDEGHPLKGWQQVRTISRTRYNHQWIEWQLRQLIGDEAYVRGMLPDPVP